MCSFMSTYKKCIKFGKSQNMSYHGFPVLITSAPFLFPPFLFQRSICRPLCCWEEARFQRPIIHSPRRKGCSCVSLSGVRVGTERDAGGAQAF